MIFEPGEYPVRRASPYHNENLIHNLRIAAIQQAAIDRYGGGKDLPHLVIAAIANKTKAS